MPSGTGIAALSWRIACAQFIPCLALAEYGRIQGITYMYARVYVFVCSCASVNTKNMLLIHTYPLARYMHQVSFSLFR